VTRARPTPPRAAYAVAALVVAATASACSSRPDGDDAARTVQDFYRAVTDDDGARACALLAPVTREALEDDTNERCEVAVVEGDLGSTLVARAPRDTSASTTVAGREAQVVVPDDVAFLTVSGTAWLITAAGCDARPDRPYDCALAGD
jgi:hypothetical protein